ncbi:unnamed protein product, partial [Didymodactylos carnosus]
MGCTGENSREDFVSQCHVKTIILNRVIRDLA